MRKFTTAFLRNPRHAFLTRSLSFNTLAVGACKPPISMAALETSKIDCRSLHADKKAGGPTIACKPNALPMGALETSKPKVRKAREPKADKNATTKAKRKATAKSTELSEIGAFKAEDVTVLDEETAAQNAEEAALHANFVFEEEKAVRNAAIERSEEVVFNATANAKQELLEWAAKLDLNTFKRGRQWEETAYKLLDHGISSAHVKRMLPKCRTLPCRTNSSDSTLNHFTMLGMSHEEMGRTISRWPSILNISNHVFQSKVEVFESVGVDRSSLGGIMYKVPRAFSSSSSTLRARCHFWKDYFQDVQENPLCTLISVDPSFLTQNLEKTVKPKIAYLEGLGFNKKDLLRRFSILRWTVKAIAVKLKVLEQYGISNTRSLVKALVALNAINTFKLHARFNNLLASGFSFDQVQKVTQNFPQLLAHREEDINLKLSYAVNVMNLSLDMIVACPPFWGYSYEKRIKYRYEVLQELKTLGAYKNKICLAYMVGMTDAQFSRRFVKRLEAHTKHSNI